MVIGILKEIKPDEYRVSMLPVGVELLVQQGHSVFVQHEAGVGSGYEDSEYAAAGATIIETAAEVFERSDLIVKVKEPVGEEPGMLRRGRWCSPTSTSRQTGS